MSKDFHLLIIDTHDPCEPLDGYVPALDLVTHGVNMSDLYAYTRGCIRRDYTKTDSRIQKKDLTYSEAKQICEAKYGNKGTLATITVDDIEEDK